jgi:3-methyladenine DNA glycosylase AlkD
MKHTDVQKQVEALANVQKAEILQRFFKTKPGEYGEGDVFVGLTVPISRSIAKQYYELPLTEVAKLLKSKIHEERLISLLILVEKFKKGTESERDKIYNFYLKHTKYINNWDLVDLSSHQIVGAYLLDKDKAILAELALSKNMWERRIAIVSTYRFIAQGKTDWTFKISKLLLTDGHDLIHKATGWMLREAGKRNLEAEENFLKKQYARMPRTMLRYAIEKFPEEKRQQYLTGKV